MLKAATRSPSPRNGFVVIPTAGHRMRGLFDRAAAFTARGREGEGRGRPMREVRLMALLYRPRPENLRPEQLI
ncbi:hypothetical protein EPO44_02405 [bacterium]|nr:MAG: hypothetical protein EPO44_02405 [bacterium]